MRHTKNDQISQVGGPRVSRRLLAAVALFLSLLPVARAQQAEEQKGVDQGNYNIKQSIEFGGRFTNLSGNIQAYDTFVNLQQGPRLLGFTTEMRSLDHHATVFDRLYFSNFGYGGDPNMATRLRVSKNKWYNLDALFRKDENVWDYALQANPLNPTTPFPNGPAGYGAPACTSCVLTNEGTEQALFENYKTTINTYRIGVDFRFVPRTNFSYDQIWNYYKGDDGITDPFQNPLFKLANGNAVDLGWSLNAGASQPCGGTFLATGFVNPGCSAAFSYFNHGRTRTNTPTEQFSMQSSYWNDLDLSARVTYSGGDTNVFGYNENFFGRTSRTNVRNDSFTGPVHGRHVAATGDFGATWHISNKLDFLDSFHFANWHNPAQFISSECPFFSSNLLTPPNVFSTAVALPITCAAPADGVAGTPVHSTSSGPDISLLNVSQFLKQDEKTNLAEVEYRFSPRFGAILGYRYRARTEVDTSFASGTFVFFPNLQNGRTPPAPYNTGTCPAAQNLADGTCILTMPGQSSSGETPIHEYAAVFGLWAHPTSNWRISFDADLMSADNSFTRVSPRQSQEYRVRSKYRAAGWLNLNGSVTIWEGRNNVFQTNDLQHNRAYGISALIQPNEKYAMEIGYDYNDVFSQILICYISVAAGQNGPGIQACPDVPGLVQQLSTYTNKSHYGFFDFTISPVRRLTARVGANLTGTSGTQLRLDPQALIPNQVTGPLNSKWLHPFGGFDYQLAKGWTGKVFWDYYGYHEDLTAGAVQDVFAPRNFRGNLVTLSVRYAF